MYGRIPLYMNLQNSYEVLLTRYPRLYRRKITIYVGMSGGVDSSVTAYLLKKDGFNVRGIYMECFKSDDLNCRSFKDRSDAVRVASFLNIPIEVWNFEKEYKEKVIDYFLDEYEKGRTPNPDILCNSEIKFNLFLERALKSGADFVATGHYAKIVDLIEFKNLPRRHKLSLALQAGQKSKIKIEDNNSTVSIMHRVNLGNRRLRIKNLRSHSSIINDINCSRSAKYFIASGKDMWKDQSYFLNRVDKDRLNKIMFPLGERTKNDKDAAHSSKESVRNIAKFIKLPVASKLDSRGICFLEQIDLLKFLKSRIPEKKGVVKNEKGETIGSHEGIYYYTIGQGNGFKIDNSQKFPLYVIRKDLKKNILIVGKKKNLLKKEFIVEDFDLRINFAEFERLIQAGSIYVRIRNLGEFVKISNINRQGSSYNYQLQTTNYLDSVAPGQFAVLYWIGGEIHNGKIIVGSGVIA